MVQMSNRYKRFGSRKKLRLSNKDKKTFIKFSLVKKRIKTKLDKSVFNKNKLVKKYGQYIIITRVNKVGSYPKVIEG